MTKDWYYSNSGLYDNKQFPAILSVVTFIDTGRKPTREEIIKQMTTQKPMISDEEAFERHLIRKYIKNGDVE